MVLTFLVLPTLTMKEAVVENSAAREEATKVERRARRSILNNFNSCVQLYSGNGELSDHIKIRHSNIFCLTGKIDNSKTMVKINKKQQDKVITADSAFLF